MKTLLWIVAMLMVVTSAYAADVGVSVTVGQPGFYGHIDIGNFPQPQIIYPKPIVIQPPPHHVIEKPVYMHVPPGHEKKWKKHCHKYNACGKPVYFVRDRWYNEVYVPKYQERHRGHGHGRDGDHDRGPGHGRGHDKDQDKGPGHGKGHGKDR